jgi:molybdenum cofactor biosynthesis enzyme MoaA
VFIFNKDINIRDYVCSPQGGYACANNKVNFYIYASGYCPAHCSFCPGYNSRQKIDLGKLRVALEELHHKQVINRISITGGEPLTDLTSFNQLLKTISDVCGTTYNVSVNTSGINLSSLRNIEYFAILDDIHISRHSEDDEENSKIFGIKTPTIYDIKKEIEQGPKIFSLSCNLLRGFIDSPEKLRKYLDTAIHVGAYQTGFVSIIDKTQVCSNLFIDYEDITSQLHIRDGFMFETMAKDQNSCKCENFRYYNDFGEIPFYLRRVLGGKPNCVKAFIFTETSNLITNFGQDKVLL